MFTEALFMLHATAKFEQNTTHFSFQFKDQSDLSFFKHEIVNNWDQ